MNTCRKFVVICISILTVGLITTIHGQQSTLSPVCDVYVLTFGGGEGGNPFLKYDISSVPAGRVIDSVFLTAYVWQVNANWDGDVNYWNVTGQAWLETDSSRLIWNLPTSQMTSQATGFGTATGWTKSVDIQSIFLIDYNAGQTYCSVKMKDPDDPTFNPMPGSYPKDPNDTISIGNRVSNQHILFYPHEYVNAPPWLVVFYHTPGSIGDAGNRTASMVTIQPNPFRHATLISVGIRIEGLGLKLYNAAGRKVNSFALSGSPYAIRWNGTDQSGRPLPAGIYFIEVSADGLAYRHQVVLTR